MRAALLCALILLLCGCAARDAATFAGTSAEAPQSRSSNSATPDTDAILNPQISAEASALPFKAHLAEGDPTGLPPAVAASLSPTSPIAIAYREQLEHAERHVSLLKSAFAPSTYAGAPLGDYGVAAFASLTITRGSELLGHYTARSYVSKSYNLYREPTHRELDEAARREVRARIDADLAADAPRLAAAVR